MILEKLQGVYGSLGDSEKRVADYILERPDDVIHYSITELARHSGASEATIYRLCRKLDFDGFQHFKIALARELSVPRQSLLETEEIQDLEKLVRTIFDENLELIKGSLELLDLSAVKEAVDVMLDARRLVFFGVGRSSPIAEEGAFRFMLLGFASNSYSDPHAQVMVASTLTSEDVVVGISHSGMIRDIVKSLQVARESGAKTIAITSGIGSPMTEVADIILYCAAGRKQSSEFLTNRVGEMVVVDMLYKCVLSMIREKVFPHFNNLSEMLKPKRF
ncbi:MAG: MurR/RpiR family transcriptional regulator [Thermotogae bacterium]|nr:MurR/RpiR family transcriptional regulator [Thermotogota bacterium]